MARKAATPGRIYQLKITLDGSKPPIWRRVEVADTATLAQLHTIIQAAMGWTDSHLHMFNVGGATYGVPDPEDEMEIRDERRIALNRLLSVPKQKLIYEYDFGDSWTHQVLLEQVGEPEPAVAYPRCTAGKRACPPEDCGGIWGYTSFLEAIADPQHPEHDEMLAWAGGAFDPARFELAEVNATLRELR